MKSRQRGLSVILGSGLSLALVLLASASRSMPSDPILHPPANTHANPWTTSVSITYDETIDPGTVTTRTFVVEAMQTGLLPGTYGVSGGTIMLTPAHPFKPGEWVQVSATTGTLNFDGQGPLLPTVWQFWTSVLAGTGEFVDSGQRLEELATVSVVLGDVDSDGDLDAFSSGSDAAYGYRNKLWLNDGLGNFSDSGQSLGRSHHAALGDLDGDRDLDLFVVDGYPPSRIWFNDGIGHFVDSGQSLDSDYSWGVALGDLDGDGDLDALVLNEQVGNRVWLNDGTGFFDPGQLMTSRTWRKMVALGDLDGDGDLDAFLGDDGSAIKSVVWLNDGTGHFNPTGQDPPMSAYGVALGDLDGDRDLDVFIATTSPNQVWLNDGSGYFWSNGQALGNAFSWEVALGDVDGDSDLDAFVANVGDNWIWLNDGHGNFYPGECPGQGYSLAIALGDVDQDGDLDAFVGNTSFNGSAADQIWLNINGIALSLTKTATPALATPGQVITYSLAYDNLGSGIATDVFISDILPISITDASYTFSGTVITPSGSVGYMWQVEDLAPREGGNIIITGILSQVLSSGSFTNTAVIHTSAPEANLKDNIGQARVEVANVPPSVVDDAYVTNEDSVLSVPVAVGVLNNDSDANGDSLVALLDTDPEHGVLALYSDGSFVYTPAADYNGLDSFAYHACDSFAPPACSIGVVSITVVPESDSPVAVDDEATTPEGIPVVVDVLANDHDADGDLLIVTTITSPANGGAVITPDYTITYTPALGFHGVDTFMYTVSDGALTDTAQVIMTIIAVPPTVTPTSTPSFLPTSTILPTPSPTPLPVSPPLVPEASTLVLSGIGGAGVMVWVGLHIRTRRRATGKRG
jgi:uncharacterized repeat protein (TIGR01451 family)